ncbi:MAG: response regulator [Deltaproteobacteria bacterium]|nr:response regulator [Deltaproteobacteria bacterium]
MMLTISTRIPYIFRNRKSSLPEETRGVTMPLANGWTIVLMDDEADIRDVMTLTLQDSGYRVLTAADGQSGVGLCEQVNPQIVITDIRMPGMDGMRVLQVLKERLPDIEVIVATAFGEMDLAIRALQLDASDFITKPIGDSALFLALSRAQQRYTSRKQIKDYTRLLEIENARTSQELAATIAFQKNLIESSMDGILGCNETGKVMIFNKAMERLLGYSKKDALDHLSLDQIFPPDERIRFNSVLSSEAYGGKNRLFLHETNLLSNTENRIPVQISAAVLMEEETISGLVCFVRDLRELRRLEQEMSDQARILHQDKMMSLGRLAASVVHEINNPLAGILNYICLMRRIMDRGPLVADQQDKFKLHLELVESETRRCAQIVSGLLTFSRKSPPSFTLVQAEDLINRCMLLSQHKIQLSRISITVFIPPSLPPVLGDFNQLQQCLINLLFNAMDAMPDGGTLDISAGEDLSKKEIFIQVKDSGPGIAPSDLPHIFEPFYTTKNEGYGVGLGLSTVYGIMERHHGSVQVESQIGKGTTFFLKLPVKGEVA